MQNCFQTKTFINNGSAEYLPKQFAKPKINIIAEEIGLKEGKDFFFIKDNCLTELEPEEIDENGVGRVLTCIGFKPLPDDIAHKISKKFQLYK